jgi:thiamine biosynthesis lipoprotein
LVARIKPFIKNQSFKDTTAEIICKDGNAIDIAFKEIERLERLLNRFDPNSEISRLSREGVYRVSKETLEIVKRSIEFSNLSDGAFDITIGAVADLWKEKIKSTSFSLPEKEEIKERLNFVGFDKVLIDEKNSIIKFSQKGLSLDLGGIAKGYAVDRVIERLKSMGIKDCLVRIGGSIYCLGKKGNRRWRVGIQHPREKTGFIDYVELENKAIDTSGDYEQFFIYEGRRYHHIISPKTGYPVNNGIVSVTVISPEAVISDFLSTAVFVLGEEKGRELAKKFKDTELIILTEKDI